MQTKIVESEHGGGRGNHGKFMLMRFTDEWEYRSRLPGADQWDGSGVPPFLLRQVCGWGPESTWVMDLQTGEGALFRPGGYAHADLDKHAVWVCPLFEPFLEYAWQWVKDGRDLWDLPDVVQLPDAEFAFQGYRRAGPERLAALVRTLTSADFEAAPLTDEDEALVRACGGDDPTWPGTPTKPRHDLDRSVAFTLLLELYPGWGATPDDNGADVTRFLHDWYEDPSLDMGEFARRWIAKEGPL